QDPQKPANSQIGTAESRNGPGATPAGCTRVSQVYPQLAGYRDQSPRGRWVVCLEKAVGIVNGLSPTTPGRQQRSRIMSIHCASNCPTILRSYMSTRSAILNGTASAIADP